MRRGTLRQLALLIVPLAFCASCVTPEGRLSDGRESNRLSFFLKRVCIPHFASGIALSDISGSERIYRVPQIFPDLLGRLPQLYCSPDPSIGCAQVEEGTCSIVVKNNEDFSSLENVVRDAMRESKSNWRSVLPASFQREYGNAYCSSNDTTSITTFGVSPHHAPTIIAQGVHQAEFDVSVSTRGEPDWCRSPCRTGNGDIRRC